MTSNYENKQFSDLITFYNQIFIKTVKPYLNELNIENKMLTPNLLLTENNQLNNKLSMTSPCSAAFLSPIVPKLQQNNSLQLIQFSPRKIVDNMSIYVSPVKHTNSIIGVPNRNKLLFSLKDTNPYKSVRTINEMIKKNEFKIKPNNKRIFNEISSNNSTSSSSIVVNPLNNNNNHTNNSNVNIIKNIKLEDETDSFTNNTRNLANRNYLTTVVSSRNNYSSNTNNLVTMVINNNNNNNNNIMNSLPSSSTNLSSNSIVGTNFARKLQSIQTERLN
jgi:hypothetical protein